MKFLSVYLLLFISVTPYCYSLIPRLPRNAIPIKFDFHIQPNIIKGNFVGRTSIELRVVTKTKTLTLHSYKLKYYEGMTLKMKKAPEKKFTIKIHEIIEMDQFLTIDCEKTLEPGDYILTLNFHGEMSHDGTGIFRVFDNLKTEKNQIIATRFMPTYARKVFPCWDEPDFRSIFSIGILHSSNFIALSNMEQNVFNFNNKKKRNVLFEETKGLSLFDEKNEITYFDETKEIPAYLLCFALLDKNAYERLSTPLGNFFLWTRSEIEELLDFAKTIADETVSFLEEYTNIAKPIPKQDIICVPKFIRSDSILEDWGSIILISEEKLLSDLKNETQKEQISHIVIHNIVHTWIGNLLTPHWWTDMWTIEGLATYIETIVPAKIRKFERLTEYAFTYYQDKSFSLDNGDSKYPAPSIRGDLNNLDDIFNKALHIQFKASMVINMIKNLQSEKTFKSRVEAFLTEFKNVPIKADNFWDAMQTGISNSFKLKDRFIAYIAEPGYPRISVERDKNAKKLKLKQTQVPSDRGQKYWVPVNVFLGSQLKIIPPLAQDWVDPSEDLIIPNIDPKDWYIINFNGIGYYQVDYDRENWEKLSNLSITSIFEEDIPPLARYSLLNDIFYLKKKNVMQDNLAKKLMCSAFLDTDLIPWQKINSLIYAFDKLTINTKHYKGFQGLVAAFIDHLIKEVREDIQSDDDSFILQTREMAFERISQLKKYAATIKVSDWTELNPLLNMDDSNIIIED